ncbi:MAG: hypothetical protein HFI43_02570 [Lachnospiraceae bacterium]|jgi:hypothetical protein|nr:hypothetical protein [Lachnospiraceae bacterium]
MSEKTEKKKTEAKQEAQQETKQEVKQEAQQETKQGAVIYLGPEIPGVVSAGMVFSRGLPPQMERTLKELPAAGKLLVPVGEAVDARKKLKNEMSAISICYKRTAEYAAGKGAGK